MPINGQRCWKQRVQSPAGRMGLVCSMGQPNTSSNTHFTLTIALTVCHKSQRLRLSRAQHQQELPASVARQMRSRTNAHLGLSQNGLALQLVGTDVVLVAKRLHSWRLSAASGEGRWPVHSTLHQNLARTGPYNTQATCRRQAGQLVLALSVASTSRLAELPITLRQACAG